MQIVVNNFHGDDLSWLPEGEVFVYDKKDKNVGSNIYDYMSWIVDHYDSMDDLVMFTKGNMLKRHITPEEWELVKNNKTFTPLLTQNHQTSPPICWYEDGLFCERADYWFVETYGVKNNDALEQMIDVLGVRDKKYFCFSPGACWIVPRENILKNPKTLYEVLREAVAYSPNPGEAHLIERSLYYLWKDDKIDYNEKRI